MLDPALNELLDKAKSQFPALAEKAYKGILQRKFVDFDCSTLPKMTNKELAAWQAKYPMDSPQYIIALQEWNNRSISRQLKWVRFAAIVGPITTVIAALLGYYLGNIQTKNQQQVQSPPAIERLDKVHAESKDVRPIVEPPLSLPLKKK